MTHDEIQELLPLEALGILDGEDARAMSAHLGEGCEECERELASLREASATLAFASDGASAPRRVSELLERRLADRGNRKIVSIAEARGRGFRTIAAGAIAAGLLLAFTIATGLRLQHELVRLRSESSVQIAALRMQIEELRSGVADASARVETLRKQLDATRTLALASYSPETKVVHLAALPAAPGASGLVVVNAHEHSALLQVSGLPQPPSGRVYEAWWIGAKSGPIRAGTFEPGRDIELTPPPKDEPIVLSAVTLEPAGGVDKPTGAMYLRGDFPH